MNSILVIEQSATLRHALKKHLSEHGFTAWCEESFKAGLHRLNNDTNCCNFSGVILSWPTQTHTSMDELLAELSERDSEELPLLVMAHEPDPAKLNWVASRSNTGFLLWNDHQDVPDTLKKLLSHETGSIAEDTVALEFEPIRVLLVDDSPTARVKFRKLLDQNGYHVDTASNVTEAFEKAKANYYEIAIIDYFMPDATGDVLVKKLRTHPGTASIISAILTSTYLDKVITDSLSAGAVECMFKNEADDLFVARVAAMSRTIRTTKIIDAERFRLEGILSSVGDGVYGVNSEGLITFVNPAVRKILGFDNETLITGRRPEDVFHNQLDDTHPTDSSYIKQAIQFDQEFHSIETVYIRNDGTPIQVELTIYPIRNDNQQEGAVIAFRDVSVRKLLEEELRWQANHDPLTKLLNRKYIEEALEKEVRHIKRTNDESALLYIDLDRFKYINDTIGHNAGDKLLQELGQQMQQRLRKADILARFGGDEFVVLLHNIEGSALYTVADNFREIIEQHTFTWEARDYTVNCSIGVAVVNQQSSSPGEVLANADIACHIAKGNGRNCTHIYSHGQDEKVAMDLELGWSHRLSAALKNNTFSLYYQPIAPVNEFDFSILPNAQGELWESYIEDTKSPIIYEVLLRLHDSNGQLILPNAFLPTAERFNMMREIDIWVLNHAMQQLKAHQAQGYKSQFSINLSGQSLESTDLIQDIKTAIDKHGVDPRNLLFEITETSAINKIDNANQIITELREIGCRFMLDDFGSGYCSFSHLKNLPVDYIKIDGLFVQNFTHDPMDRAIVTSINNIAHSLGKKTIAEFVENAETLKALKECGIDYIQGYYFSHPLAVLPPGETQIKATLPDAGARLPDASA